MKVLVFFACVVHLSLTKEIFDVNSLDIKNLEFDLDPDFVEEFLEQYEVGDSSGITAVVNEYADKIFQNIEVFATKNHLDPLNLTDVKDEFLGSSLTLTNGNLNGIATIVRSEDCVVSYSTDSKKLEVNFPIEFSNLNFTYDYHVVILLIGPRGSLVGKVKEFRMNVKIQFDFNTYHAAIEEVKTGNKGHVSVTIHGNALIDIVVNILSEFVTVVLQPLIGLIIEGVVKNVVELVVDTVNNAIDSILYPATASTVAALL